MKGKKFAQIALALVLTLGLAVVASLGAAQGSALQEPGGSTASAPLGTAFTYQGQLEDNRNLVTGQCDFQFSLWDALSGGNQIGPTLSPPPITLVDGRFTVELDFGAGAFQGKARWLEIAVRCPAGSGDYVTLEPRQALTAAPHSLYSRTAPWSGLAGMPAGFADGVDDNTTYDAGTGLVLSDTTFSADTDYLQRRVGDSCSAGYAIRVVNADGTVVCEPMSGIGAFWSLTGNAGTEPGTNYLGTSDDQALELKVNDARALRLEPSPTSPNLIGGHSSNEVTGGAYGVTIGGGGSASQANRATDSFGTVGGGWSNQAGDGAGTTGDTPGATVGGGSENAASGDHATVAGGEANAAGGWHATVGGGSSNAASGLAATVAGGSSNAASGWSTTVGGGTSNASTGWATTVAGGGFNGASGWAATVGGGAANLADVEYATVPGGAQAAATHYGEMAYSSGAFAITGDAQASLYVLRALTTSDGVWESLYLNGSDRLVTLSSGRTLAFDILLAGRSSAGESAGYRCEGVIERSGDTTALVGSSCSALGEDDWAWDARVVADDTADALLVQVMGNGESVRWAATVRATELAYP